MENPRRCFNCRRITRTSSPLCSMCRGKASSAERGYGAEHRRQRDRWATIIARQGAQCHARECKMLSRYIAPGHAWDLGHTPDRAAWTGPEHRRCNRSEGATRGNRTRGHGKSTRQPVPQRWAI